MKFKLLLISIGFTIAIASNAFSTDYLNEPWNLMEMNYGEDWDTFYSSSMVNGDGDIYPVYPGYPSTPISNETFKGLNGNGYLDGTYVKVVDNEPGQNDAFSATNSFVFSPSTSDFDEANVYYHIDTFRRDYIETLDDDNELFTQITARVRSTIIDCTGAGSCYLAFGSSSIGEIHFMKLTPSTFPKEDKVMYHEYTHSIIKHFNDEIKANVNNEEGAIVEGVADYFAGTFTNRPDILEYASSGDKRTMECPKPEYQCIEDYQEYEYEASIEPVEVHAGGEFFSNILWDLRADLGQSITDQLVFDVLDELPDDPTFEDFRDELHDVDMADNNNVNFAKINDAFADNGIGDYVPPGPPENLEIVNISASSGFVELDWDDNPEENMDHYEVWRQHRYIPTSTTDDPVKIAESSTSSYTDYSVYLNGNGDDEWRYYVTAVNEHDKISRETPYTSYVTGIGNFKVIGATQLPENFGLDDNFPNPFNPSTQIKFELPETSEVTLKVYNVMGQQVATLLNEQVKAGFHQATFNADNLASGIYIARLVAVGSEGESFSKEIKMQLVK